MKWSVPCSIERITACNQLNGLIPPSILRLRAHRHCRLWYKLNAYRLWLEAYLSSAAEISLYLSVIFSFHSSCFCTSHPWVWMMHSTETQHGCGRELMSESFPPLLSSAVDVRKTGKRLSHKGSFSQRVCFFYFRNRIITYGFSLLFIFSLFTPFAVLRSLLLQQSMFIVHPERILAKSMDIGTALDWMLWKGALHSPI